MFASGWIGALIDEDQLIAPRPDVDYRTLSSQPTPEDFFLLSRVQGVVSVSQLCKVSGLGRDKTMASVSRLLEVGLLHEVDETGKPIPSRAMRSAVVGLDEPLFPPQRDSEPRESFDIGAPLSEPISDPFTEDLDADPNTAVGMLIDDEDDLIFGSPAGLSRADSTGFEAPPQMGERATRPPTAPGKPGGSVPVGPAETVSKKDVDPYHAFPAKFADFQLDPETIVEGIDLETQREIHFVYDHLDHIDFYQLFGVSRDADRKEIRAQYFRMSKRFHPDKFFREDPGGVGARVEAVFKFVTKAQETLTKRAKREEYDRALAQLQARVEQESHDDGRKREMAAEMLERRAQALEQQGELLRAAQEYKKVAAIRRDAGALLRAANLLLRANQQLDEAARLARGACQQMPEAAEPRMILGQIYEQNAMWVEALSAFEEAMELSPGDPAVRVHVERVRSHLR